MLTLIPDMQLSSGREFRGLGDPSAYVFQYTVGGWPVPGQEILICDWRARGRAERWRISRRLREWDGDYETPEAALNALRSALNTQAGKCP
jgi:hypothetical protein